MRECILGDLRISHVRVGDILTSVGAMAKTRRIRILDNGHGWLLSDDGEHTPAIFYLEDVLYRLDLQGKLE